MSKFFCDVADNYRLLELAINYSQPVITGYMKLTINQNRPQCQIFL